jgi:endonuclease/exonuclease/phosphatase (EEP) superfamily protein YafD
MSSTRLKLATAALVLVGAPTAIGLLAPWWPRADIPNNFSPYLVAVSLAAVALISFQRPKRSMWLVLISALFMVAAINAAPVLRALTTTAVAAKAPTDTLTVVSFNVWTKNRRVADVVRWLADQKADLVILQEMSGEHREPIKQALAAEYPHIHDCGCNDIVMLSRRPWRAAGGQSRTPEQPAMSWFTLIDNNGSELRVVGLRPRYINQPEEFAAHYDWLVHHANVLGRRAMLVGDFNAAPWSSYMLRFGAASGLRRHGTSSASWPSQLPLVLIDNVLTTPNIAAVSFEVGPDLGSDHRPIVATVALQQQ